MSKRPPYKIPPSENPKFIYTTAHNPPNYNHPSLQQSKIPLTFQSQKQFSLYIPTHGPFPTLKPTNLPLQTHPPKYFLKNSLSLRHHHLRLVTIPQLPTTQTQPHHTNTHLTILLQHILKIIPTSAKLLTIKNVHL